ncbi:YadA family autotransporter adhesin, partial [[Pasteurella] aerogenes]
GDQTVDGNSYIKGDQEVDGNSHIKGDQAVDGNLNVKGNADIQGSQHVGGDQQVDGNSHIKGSQAVDGNLNVKGNADIQGSQRVGGDQQVDGDQTVKGNQEVDGNSHIKGDQAVDGNLNVKGNADIQGSQRVGGDQQVDGDQNIKGNQHVEGNQEIDGNSHIKGDQAVDGNLNVKGNADIQGSQRVGGDQQVDGNQTVKKDLTVEGNTTLGGEGKSFTVKNGTAINMGGNKVSGVADGDISPTSQDAVNGSQVYILTKGAEVVNGDNGLGVKVDGKEYDLTTYDKNGKADHSNSVITAIHKMNNDGIKYFHANGNDAVAGARDPNSEDSRATGARAVGVGYQSDATGTDSVAIGSRNVAAGDNSGAIGTTNEVKGNNSYAVGQGNKVDTDNTYVLGGAVRDTLANSVFLGDQTGYIAPSERSYGNTAGTTGQVIGGRHYAYAGGGVNEVAGVVSVGNGTQTRRIQGVAPGLIGPQSTDAINGSQLYSTISGFNNSLADVNRRMNDLDHDLRSGIAGAVAMATLVQAYNPGDSLLAVGGGTYRGASALALGYSKVSDNGKIIFKVSGSVNNAGHYMGGASIGYKF